MCLFSKETLWLSLNQIFVLFFFDFFVEHHKLSAVSFDYKKKTQKRIFSRLQIVAAQTKTRQKICIFDFYYSLF